MLDEFRVQQILGELGADYINQNGSFKCKCFICGDSKKHKRVKRLKISPYKDTWVAYCWNGGCDVKGMSFYSLYSQATGMGYTEAKRYINNDKYNTNKIKIKLKPPKKIKTVDLHKEDQQFDIDLHDECLNLDSTPDGRIQERLYAALQQFTASRYLHDIPLSIAHSGKYKGRVIIPVIINDELVYYQGRAIIDSMEPKYFNPEVDKEGIIMNSDHFSKDKYIILTEGIVDAYMVDYNQGCPFLGSFVNDKFIDELLKYTDKGIIIAWDNPFIDKAGKEEIEKFIKGSKYSKNVKYFLAARRDFKDLNDLKILEPKLNIYDYVVNNSYSYINTTIKMKLI